MYHFQHSSSASSRSESMVASGPVPPEELAEIRRQLARLTVACDDLEDISDGIVPRRIGRFEIREEIGSGSSGTVYIAYDPKMSRNVAIKVAHLAANASEGLRRKFLAEAHAAARMAHPNVVTVHEYGEDSDLLYIVYQLCVGVTLEEWLSDQPDRIAPAVAVELIRQLAQGLAHAHVRGIVHRDVKPSNIVLQREGDSEGVVDSAIEFTPRLTDFGLAHDLLARETSMVADGFLGTIDYMSPEQVQCDGRSRSPTSDIYALGVILYRMLTGVLPARGDDIFEKLRQICSMEPVAPRQIHPAIPRDLAAICCKCLEKQPWDRYPSCKALIADLEKWRSGKAVSVRPQSALERAWRMVARAQVVWGLAVTVLLMSFLSTVVFFHLNVELQKKNVAQANLLAIAIEAVEATAAAERETADKGAEAIQRHQQSILAANRADLHLAYENFDEGRLFSAEEILDRIRERSDGMIPPSVGYRILEARLAEATQRLVSHQRGANAVVAVPDSSLVVSGGDDGRLSFQDVATGELPYTHHAPAGWKSTALAINREGSHIAVGWNAPAFGNLGYSVACVYELDRHREDWLASPIHTFALPSTCQSLCFSPSGRQLALGPRYGVVVIRDLESGEAVSVKSDGRHNSLEFSPDGMRVLVVTKQNSLLIADANTGEIIAPVLCERRPRCAIFTPDNRMIATGFFGSDDVVLFSATAPHQALVTARQSRGEIQALSVSSSGTHLIAGTRAGGVVVWDLKRVGAGLDEPLEPVLEVAPHSGFLTATAVVDDKWIVSTDDAGSVRTTSLPTALPPCEEMVPTALTCCPALGPGRYIAGFDDGSIKTIDGGGRQLAVLFQGDGCPVTALGVSRDASQLAAGWENGRVAITPIGSPAEWSDCLYDAPLDSLDLRVIRSIQFSRDGKKLAACGEDARARLWRVAHPQAPIWESVFTSRAVSVCFIGGDRLACGGLFEQIAILDVAQGKLLYKIPGTHVAETLLHDAQRQVLVSGHADGRIRIHSTRDWESRNTLGNSRGEIRSLRLAPGKGYYLVGTSRGHVELWDADAHFFIGTLRRFPDARSIDAMELDDTLRLLTLSCTGEVREFQAGLHASLSAKTPAQSAELDSQR